MLKIIFMGSPDFAVPSLRILIENGYNVVAVITATDKYGGRGGKKLLETDVKKYAVSQNIPVLQPKNLKSPEFIEELKSYQADLQIVVAFRMLPVVVWDMPKHGTYNLHGSLLPKYRGAAPIHWAVIKGETETGVTSFKLKHAIDTGDYLFQEKIEIGPDETTGELYNRMKEMGAETILKTVQAVESNHVVLIPQDDSMATKAPKLYHETTQINWDQDINSVYNFIRGLSPYPVAWTWLDGLQFNVIEARKIEDSSIVEAGMIQTNQKNYLAISAIGGWIEMKKIQLQGKRRMMVNDFLNGYKIKDQKITLPETDQP